MLASGNKGWLRNCPSITILWDNASAEIHKEMRSGREWICPGKRRELVKPTHEHWVYLAGGESSTVFQGKRECQVQYGETRHWWEAKPGPDGCAWLHKSFSLYTMILRNCRLILQQHIVWLGFQQHGRYIWGLKRQVEIDAKSWLWWRNAQESGEEP